MVRDQPSAVPIASPFLAVHPSVLHHAVGGDDGAAQLVALTRWPATTGHSHGDAPSQEEIVQHQQFWLNPSKDKSLMLVSASWLSPIAKITVFNGIALLPHEQERADSRCLGLRDEVCSRTDAESN